MKKPTQILDGKVVSAVIKPEIITKTVTKMMKVVMITRTPEGRIASVQLSLRGRNIALDIDEATARAIAKIFD